mmetsp:Transcript_43435/g.31721  ORF Transcript_43435/g.31721 Transcript_43435/m.31721 type:complete len:105 (-) Transcript_43435:60-374(-)|eukprot:CAMPEP_0202962316 /NCGR_PEP_ID=MMETSP1396-20130829/6405_1 /ASSEMBLY_ACC=CAM_ASM_000872 /TAXON_ID= /ORGANISM="Pseudokeronopsis sp., Strain Brazil" /LENGTH=104 /DNA_ID=CAMNT_0049682789 /DNA_START=234 /DNA_END=548 /DNA_ORIENTATION=+
MIMEHFEVHKEQLEDLILELDKYGPKVLADIPEESSYSPITINDMALIDELSGLTLFVDNLLKNNNVPVTVKERIEAQMLRYEGPKDKQVAMNELKIKIFGDSR